MSTEDTGELTVGEMIRRDREAAGLTIPQLAQATKIMFTFVEALERDDIKALPGRVFAKGFIKNIYKVLGKDSQKVIERFEQEHATEQTRVVPVTHVERAQTNIVRHQKSSRGVPGKMIAGAALLGLALIAAVWLLKPGASEKQNPANQQPEVSQPSTAAVDDPEPEDYAASSPSEQEIAEEVAVDEDLAANLDEAPNGEAGPANDPEVLSQSAEVAAMQAGSNSAEEQLIEIVVSKKVKIRMNLDQKGWETNELEPDTYQFRFEDAASLLVFDASAVDMSFNGKNLGKLGEEGRVRRLSFVAGSPAADRKM